MNDFVKSSLKSKLSIRCIKIAGDHVPSPKNTPPSIERRGKSRSSTPKQKWKFDNDELAVDSINVNESKVTCQ